MATDLPSDAAPPGSVLVGARGDVLGIVTGQLGNEALATPAWIASGVVDQLLASGTVEHGWLGIEGTTTNAPVRGVTVTLVSPGSAAARAGVRAGDVIVSVAGRRVTSMAQLQGRLYFSPPGSRVRVGVVRSGRTLDVVPVLDGSQVG